MLLALRLPPLVGGDDEQDERHRPDAGQHVADEPLVAGHVDEPDLAAVGSVHQAYPRSIVRPRRFSSAQRSGSMPVSRDDQARLAVVDVAGRGDDAQLARHQSSSGRRPPGRTGSRGSRSWTSSSATVRRSNSRCVGLDAAEDRRASRPAAGRRTRPDRAADLDAPRRDRAAGHGAAADHGLARAHVAHALEVAAERRRQLVRAALHLFGRRPQHAVHGQLVLLAADVRGRARPRAPPPASCPRGRRARSDGGAAARSGRHGRTTMPACGPPSSLSPENVTRSAPSASASRTAGSSAGIPS